VQELDAVLVVTFDVDGIWKGDVAKRALFYRPIYRPPRIGGRSGGLKPFEMGKRYLVGAHVLGDQERDQFGVNPKPGILAVDTCGSGSRPFDAFANAGLKEMGTGRKPE
jgi:hypothetical protein